MRRPDRRAGSPATRTKQPHDSKAHRIPAMRCMEKVGDRTRAEHDLGDAVPVPDRLQAGRGGEVAHAHQTRGRRRRGGARGAASWCTFRESEKGLEPATCLLATKASGSLAPPSSAFPGEGSVGNPARHATMRREAGGRMNVPRGRPGTRTCPPLYGKV
jgi:hypothetical protein